LHRIGAKFQSDRKRPLQHYRSVGLGMKNSQKVALVTGASSGIGKATAKRLAQSGYRVFGTCRHPGEKSEPGVEMISMDADNDGSVSAAVKYVIASAGGLDAVINNAGWALNGPIEETSIAEARALMETNFFGVLRVCREVLPILRERGRGHIINISSLSGTFGTPFSGLYSASKFAVEGLSEALSLETRRMGISVSLVEPGDIDTQLPVNRRYTKASQKDGPYAQVYKRYLENQAKDETNALGPEAVASVVLKILRSPRPRMRYSVAKVGQRIVIPLKRFTPYRLFEWIVATAVGL
jgi:NAD(P)-dependent dehydrogenase (short-subunit alcohol dehydrogenase family)